MYKASLIATDYSPDYDFILSHSRQNTKKKKKSHEVDLQKSQTNMNRII